MDEISVSWVKELFLSVPQTVRKVIWEDSLLVPPMDFEDRARKTRLVPSSSHFCC
jgi:hypothetical protein